MLSVFSHVAVRRVAKPAPEFNVPTVHCIFSISVAEICGSDTGLYFSTEHYKAKPDPLLLRNSR